LGLVARCRRIVVVGDKKQLPPTRFCNRMIADRAASRDAEATAIQHGESAAPITDLESILSLCEARGLESRMLRWPYPVAAKGLSLRRVPGAHDRSCKRTI
jgi:superfamily I DNA and/or RNA helicase